KGLTAAEMRAAASPFITDVADWRSQPLHRLIILPNLVFEEQRVCAIWTCPGMLKRAEAARNKVVKLAIDGKQKLALVNSEAEANVTQFFSTACEIASQCCKLDLKTQVWQVHKDFAKGIEAARRKVFPFARPCDDYPHMRRASYNVLKQKMGVPSARRQKGGRKDKTATPFDELDDVIRISRVLPTIILFDAVWHVTFAWLQKVSKQACDYLKSTYFNLVERASLEKQFWCGTPVFHSTCCWFAGFWAGVTGTYPGSGSGTQPLESFHAYWQDAVRASVRSDPRAIFSRMERLYEEDWATKFAWQDARVFQT
ncbi:unnamed protein product, partial [Symbiodinium pilosum]